MCYRAPVAIRIYATFFILFSRTFGLVHKSSEHHVPCSTYEAGNAMNAPAFVESYLLSEGESLSLDCGVCRQCDNHPVDCWENTDISQWTIQRTRFLGYGGDARGNVDDSSSDLYKIRQRLAERIWPKQTGVSEELRSVIFSEINLDDDRMRSMNILSEINSETKRKQKRNLTHPLAESPRLYIFVAKPSEPGYVMTRSHGKFGKGRIQLIKDNMIIKQTRTEDTGMYYCYYEGRRIREWVVTVVPAHDEPFRYVPQPIGFDRTALEKLREQNDGDNRTLPDEVIPSSTFIASVTTPLSSKYLLKHNLQIHTVWSSWTECSPCTPSDQLPRSPEPAGDGFQIRVGICRVFLLDDFHPVRPHELALKIDALLRMHKSRGLPCRSHLIRDAMRQFGPKALIIRPSEIMLRECVRVCPTVKRFHPRIYKLPKRIQLRVNEGERLVISCPIRGAVAAPISWFYSPLDMDELVNLTTTAFMSDTIKLYGSPSMFLATLLYPVNLVNLFESTRGRYRIDAAQNLIVAEAIANPPLDEVRLNHLICIHGDARTPNESEVSDWAGIIDIEVVPRTYSVVVMSKLSQVVLLVIPFILAVGTFVVIAVTMQTERKPNMRAAADGFTNKPPP